MTWIEALILGILQGLAEFLPISSSGHLEIGKVLLGIEQQDNLTFTVVVHGATVLSTIVVFRKEIGRILKGLTQLRQNDEWSFTGKIALSMIPVLALGLFFKEEVEALFTGNLLLVGSMLVFTATLLGFAYFSKSKERSISYLDAFIIGIAQALAVIPGISRSGATIATGIILGNKKEQVAEFSFLMVLVPILGANFLDIMSQDFSAAGAIEALPLIIGFISSFVVGYLACTWMINIVKRGKLIYFALYCLLVGSIAIASQLFF